MDDYQRDFITFAMESGALKFGEFELKSGRISPYFFNTGVFNTGRQLAELARFYARAIEASNVQFDLLYGPAYKGIPLAAATAIALYEITSKDIPYAFNRKETKKHGEGGTTVGAPIAGRVLIIDDVISAGTSVRESLQTISTTSASAVGVVISLDRQERGESNQSALAEIGEEFGLAVVAVASLSTLAAYLEQQKAPQLDAIRAYQNSYGAD